MATNTSQTPAATNPFATSIAASTAKKPASGVAADRATLAGNYDNFLKLLTTQLKNQNPSSPLDPNQFTSELVQFSSVEQQLKTNDSLAQLLIASRTQAAASALDFVGTKVVADGSTTRLAAGKAEWRLNSPQAVGAATFTINDAAGNQVWSETRALAAGAQAFTWNGRGFAGAALPEGAYTLTVSAQVTNGSPVGVGMEVSGTVDSVTLADGQPILTVGATRVAADKVKSISR